LNGAGERRLTHVQRSKDDTVELDVSLASFAFDSGRVGAVEGAERTEVLQLILPKIWFGYDEVLKRGRLRTPQKAKAGRRSYRGYSLAQPDSYAF
jgi:hypothetical protein